MKITPLAVSTLSILVSVACAQTSIPQSDIDAYKSLKSAFNAAAAPQLTQAEQDREAMHELLRADREALKGSAKYQEYLGKTHPVKKEMRKNIHDSTLSTAGNSTIDNEIKALKDAKADLSSKDPAFSKIQKDTEERKAKLNADYKAIDAIPEHQRMKDMENKLLGADRAALKAAREAFEAASTESDKQQKKDAVRAAFKELKVHEQALGIHSKGRGEGKGRHHGSTESSSPHNYGSSTISATTASSTASIRYDTSSASSAGIGSAVSSTCVLFLIFV